MCLFNPQDYQVTIEEGFTSGEFIAVFFFLVTVQFLLGCTNFKALWKLF